jgi:hypothetical protein
MRVQQTGDVLAHGFSRRKKARTAGASGNTGEAAKSVRTGSFIAPGDLGVAGFLSCLAMVAAYGYCGTLPRLLMMMEYR